MFIILLNTIMSEKFYLCPYVSPNVRSFVPSVLKLKLSSGFAMVTLPRMLTLLGAYPRGFPSTILQLVHVSDGILSQCCCRIINRTAWLAIHQLTSVKLLALTNIYGHLYFC